MGKSPIWTLCLAGGVGACSSSGSDGSSSSGTAAVEASTAVQTSTTEVEPVASPSSGAVELAPGCVDPVTAGATAPCLLPTMEPEYYVAEAEAYFDTLDIDASRDSVPNYHPQVARWEWPPWLYLTGYTDIAMISTADALRVLDPSKVPERDCRFFEVQPFARCYVVFEYEEGPCPIYEEFTFNDAGEMTFIEAWSDLPSLLPQDESDPWAESPDYPRLATKIPGLGKPNGTIDLESPEMTAAAEADPEIADFVRRARDWRAALVEASGEADPNFFAMGCGWKF